MARHLEIGFAREGDLARGFVETRSVAQRRSRIEPHLRTVGQRDTAVRALRRLDRKKLFGPFCRKEMQHERRDERQHRGRSRDTQPQTAQRTPSPNLPPQRIERIEHVGRRNMVALPTALPLPHLREALRISVEKSIQFALLFRRDRPLEKPEGDLSDPFVHGPYFRCSF